MDEGTRTLALQIVRELIQADRDITVNMEDYKHQALKGTIADTDRSGITITSFVGGELEEEPEKDPEEEEDEE